MVSYQFRKSHCRDKTILRSSYLHNGISYTGYSWILDTPILILRSSYLHNGISYTGKMPSLYWISPLFAMTYTTSAVDKHSHKWHKPVTSFVGPIFQSSGQITPASRLDATFIVTYGPGDCRYNNQLCAHYRASCRSLYDLMRSVHRLVKVFRLSEFHE